MDGWLTNAKPNTRSTSWVHYEQLTRMYILPNIGSIKLKDLRADHVRSMYNQLLKMEIGVHTVQKILAILQLCLESGYQDKVNQRKSSQFY